MKETVYYFGAQRKERESLQKAIMQKIFQPGERYGHPHSQDSKNFKEVECYELWKYTHNIQTFSCFNQDKKAKSQMNERRVSITRPQKYKESRYYYEKNIYIYSNKLDNLENNLKYMDKFPKQSWYRIKLEASHFLVSTIIAKL